MQVSSLKLHRAYTEDVELPCQVSSRLSPTRSIADSEPYLSEAGQGVLASAAMSHTLGSARTGHCRRILKGGKMSGRNFTENLDSDHI